MTLPICPVILPISNEHCNFVPDISDECYPGDDVVSTIYYYCGTVLYDENSQIRYANGPNPSIVCGGG